MKEINSKNNKVYKLCVQLESRKYRDRLGLYLIEGENLLREAVSCNAPLYAVLVRADRRAPDFGSLPEPFFVEEKLFGKLAQTETSQGILAVAEKKHWNPDAFFKHCEGGNLLVLDRVQDPGNIGTMLRTAEAAGYAGAVVLKGTGDIYAPKVARAAAGSLFRLPVLFTEDPGQTLSLLEENRKRAVGACMDAEICYYDADLERDVALLIGNEGNGLCDAFLAGAEQKVRVPMDCGVDSLNAAVAAGILMFESKRQKKETRIYM